MAEVVAQLTDQLKAQEATVRADAAERLARLEEQARDAAVELVRAAADAEEEVREWAVAALEGLGPPNAGDLDQLAGLVVDPHDDVSYWATTLLGRAGTAASGAAGALGGLLTGPRSAVIRRRAAWALGRIGPAPGAIDALSQAARDANPQVARAAQQSLEQIAEGNRK